MRERIVAIHLTLYECTLYIVQRAIIYNAQLPYYTLSKEGDLCQEVKWYPSQEDVSEIFNDSKGSIHHPVSEATGCRHLSLQSQ